jgi:hypothetical protein
MTGGNDYDGGERFDCEEEAVVYSSHCGNLHGPYNND